MSKTIVGLFNSTAAAQQVKQSLVADGYDSSNIRIVANNHEDDSQTSTESGEGRSSDTGTGIGHKISEFFHSLTGGDEHAHSNYASGVNEGGALLTVRAEDEEASEIANLLRQHGARNIDEGSQQTGSQQTGSQQTMGAGAAGYGAGTGREFAASDAEQGVTSRDAERDVAGRNQTGETAIPVVEEELVIGKREVDRGGVRIYSHVVEQPAEADVTLRDERINVERRPVNRPASAADFEAGNGSSFELRASGEEAVVGKNSRVVEEVLVGKQANQRTEAIHDTVRKTEVEVENIAGETRTQNDENLTEKNRY